MDEEADIETLALEAVVTLSEHEQTILRLRFGLDGRKPKSLEKIGMRFGVGKERIRQMQNVALSKLRKAAFRCKDAEAILRWAHGRSGLYEILRKILP